MLYFEDEQGRLMFRPFGAGGPCYLTTPGQRTSHIMLLLAYYAVMIAAVYAFMTDSGIGIVSGTLILATLMGHYVLSWLFTRSLTRATPEPVGAPGSFQDRRKARNRNFGKTFLMLMVVFSAVLTVVSILMLMRTDHTGVGLLAAAFFGICTIVFARTFKIVA